jgi:phage gp45-like
MRSKEVLLESTDPRWIKVAGMVRRMAISLTSKVLWQLVGFQLPDGSKEVSKAEAFTGIGFFARPPSSGSPEAIVVSVGDASAPMIVAVRDEKTRAAIVGALKVGESAVYNDKAIVYVKDDGTIEARTATGLAST